MCRFVCVCERERERVFLGKGGERKVNNKVEIINSLNCMLKPYTINIASYNLNQRVEGEIEI